MILPLPAHESFSKMPVCKCARSRGLPFAMPPTGSLRFMPPSTVSPWREVRPATEFGPVCPQVTPQIKNISAALATMSQARIRTLQQILPKLVNQSEDCLYLNVYAPYSGKKDNVWAIGGENKHFIIYPKTPCLSMATVIQFLLDETLYRSREAA